MNCFELDKVELRRGETVIINIPQLSIPARGITGILGPNGVGKSTLMRALLGLDKESLGDIRFFGQNVCDIDSIERSRQLAYVPSNTSLSFDAPVIDIVLLGRYPWHQGFPKASDRDQAKAVLEKLGLSHLKNRMAKSLSSGEWQKVQIARALVTEVKCLVLDEPCAHLDLKARWELIELLHQLASEDRAVILSSHDQYLMPKYYDYHMAFKNGLLYSSGQGTLSKSQISELFDLDLSRWEQRT